MKRGLLLTWLHLTTTTIVVERWFLYADAGHTDFDRRLRKRRSGKGEGETKSPAATGTKSPFTRTKSPRGSKVPKASKAPSRADTCLPNQCECIAPCDEGGTMCLPLSNLDPNLGQLEFCVPPDFVGDVFNFDFGASCGECPGGTLL
jgi:hypothetical protein